MAHQFNDKGSLFKHVAGPNGFSYGIERKELSCLYLSIHKNEIDIDYRSKHKTQNQKDRKKQWKISLQSWGMQRFLEQDTKSTNHKSKIEWVYIFTTRLLRIFNMLMFLVRRSCNISLSFWPQNPCFPLEHSAKPQESVCHRIYLEKLLLWFFPQNILFLRGAIN